MPSPIPARRDAICGCDWTNEEGARFQPSLTGSAVFAGSLPLERAYACEDGDGVTLGDALAGIGYRGASPLEFEPVRYVELHVEQGDQLERAAADIAAVSGAWMTRKISVVFDGEVSHTGPTPMANRRDALRGAARAIEALYIEIEHANAAPMPRPLGSAYSRTRQRGRGPGSGCGSRSGTRMKRWWMRSAIVFWRGSRRRRRPSASGSIDRRR